MKISKNDFFFYSCWLLCLFVVAGCTSKPKKQVVICSKDFTEQAILAEILAQHIEAKTDIKVKQEKNLGGALCHQSLTAGKIDLYVEYTGTAYVNLLKQKPISDPKEVLDYLKQEYPKQFKAEWTEPLGFSNSFAIIVRGDQSKTLNLQTLSQLGKASPKLRAGFGPEFNQREDGFPGLAKTYGIKFREEPKELLLGLLYQALQQKEVDVIAGSTTDGLIQSLGLVVLQDDKNYFPPYEAVPVVRSQILEKYPELRQVLAELGGKISEEDMRKLNYQADGEQQEAGQVAREFLQQKLGDSKPVTPAK
jgi:osmoprotectant transport system substrate-binding protein